MPPRARTSPGARNSFRRSVAPPSPSIRPSGLKSALPMPPRARAESGARNSLRRNTAPPPRRSVRSSGLKSALPNPPRARASPGARNSFRPRLAPAAPSPLQFFVPLRYPAPMPDSSRSASPERLGSPTKPCLRRLVEGKRRRHYSPDAAPRKLGFRGWHERGHLPHFDAPGVTQLVTVNIADAFPVT